MNTNKVNNSTETTAQDHKIKRLKKHFDKLLKQQSFSSVQNGQI